MSLVIRTTGTRCQNGTLARISGMSPWWHARPQSANDKRQQALHRCLTPFAARRADIERFARALEALGRVHTTITRPLCTVAGFCRYAVDEALLGHSPGAHVRRQRLDYEAHVTGLDRNEMGTLLIAAGLGLRPSMR